MKEMTGRWKIRKKKGGLKWVWKNRKVDHKITAEDLHDHRSDPST